MATPLRVLEADLIHPRGKPVGVWETKIPENGSKSRIWGLKIAKNGSKRSEKAILGLKIVFWTANSRKLATPRAWWGSSRNGWRNGDWGRRLRLLRRLR